MNFVPVMNFGPVRNYGPVKFGPVTDRQKAMHMSPPCISTGVLKNKPPHVNWCCILSANIFSENLLVPLDPHMFAITHNVVNSQKKKYNLALKTAHLPVT